MRTDETARMDLLRGLEQLLGEERASTLMSYLPTDRDLATRQDIRDLEARVDVRFAAFEEKMDVRFAAFEEKMDVRFAAFEEKMDVRFAAFEEKMDVRFAAFEELMDERFAAFTRAVNERFAASRDYTDTRFNHADQSSKDRFDALRELMQEHYAGIGHMITIGDERTATALHKEMSRLITSQTRFIVLAILGALAAIMSVVLVTT